MKGVSMKKSIATALGAAMLSGLLAASVAGAATTPPAPPPAKPAPLVLSAFSVTSARFAVGPQPTAVSAAVPAPAPPTPPAAPAPQPPKPPQGTLFGYAVSAPAVLTIDIQRMLDGRQVGTRCAKPSRKNRKRKHCIRYTKAGTLTRNVKQAGAGSVPFSGRIADQALLPGRYEAIATATAGGQKSNAKQVRFEVVLP
jgi:hypothetical protein